MRNVWGWLAGVAVACVGFSWADDQQERLQELERKVGILSEEIEKAKLGEAAREYESANGMGPAASMVYRTKSGLSVAGYGEMTYQHFADLKQDGSAGGKLPSLDFVRFITYFGYRFSDAILFNSEVEIEHAHSKLRGEVALEFGYLDWAWSRALGLRVGLMLVPVGLTNELHEPPVFWSARRPEVESAIIPTTWRENGVGLYGQVGDLTYRSYLVNGFQAVKDATATSISGFSGSGLRGGRQSGSSANAKSLGWVTRVDFTGLPGWVAGGSLYLGNSGQGSFTAAGKEILGGVLLWDLHVRGEWQGWFARAMFTQAIVSDVADLNAANGLTGNKSIGERLWGGYVEVGVDVLTFLGEWRGQALTPFVRYERLDTQAAVPSGFSSDGANDQALVTAGVGYKPHPNVVFKADAQMRTNAKGTGLNQFNLSSGFMF